MEKLIRTATLKSLTTCLMILFFTHNVKAQKLSDVINAAISYLNTTTFPIGGGGLPIVNIGFTIDDSASLILIHSNGSSELSVGTKNNVINSVTSPVQFLISTSTTNPYIKCSKSKSAYDLSVSNTYFISTNNSIVSNLNLLPDLLTITYKGDGTTNTVSLNNSALVTKGVIGSTILYGISQIVGSKKIRILLIFNTVLTG